MRSTERVKNILDKTIKDIPLSIDDYMFLQNHEKEVKETHDLKLIELSLNSIEHEPSYKFLKVI